MCVPAVHFVSWNVYKRVGLLRRCCIRSLRCTYIVFVCGVLLNVWVQCVSWKVFRGGGLRGGDNYSACYVAREGRVDLLHCNPRGRRKTYVAFFWIVVFVFSGFNINASPFSTENIRQGLKVFLVDFVNKIKLEDIVSTVKQILTTTPYCTLGLSLCRRSHENTWKKFTLINLPPSSYCTCTLGVSLCHRSHVWQHLQVTRRLTLATCSSVPWSKHLLCLLTFGHHEIMLALEER